MIDSFFDEIIEYEDFFEIKYAFVRNKIIQAILIENKQKTNLLGKIYSGKIIRIIDSLNLLFVDIGLKDSVVLNKKDAVNYNELHAGKKINVQIIKEPDKNKQAKVTMKISDLNKNRLKQLVDKNKSLIIKSNELYEKYDIDRQLKKIFDKKVNLTSGGNIVIEKTEGMTIIDVNSATSNEIDLTNLEASKEVARQIRLRNISGIIIVDFINTCKYNEEKILKNLKKECSNDYLKVNICEITQLGLIQITRKKQNSDLVEQLGDVCEKCNGLGFIYSVDAICYEILAKIYKNNSFNKKGIKVIANKEVIFKLKIIADSYINDNDIILEGSDFCSNGQYTVDVI